MLGKIGRFSSGRRTKWYVVGIWLVLVVLSTLPGQLAQVTEDRISSFLPDDAPAIVADKVIEERFPGGQTTSSVAVYHREGGLTDADQQTIAAEAQQMGEVGGVLPPVVPFSAEAPEGLVSQDGSTAFTVIPINATTQQEINTLTEEVREFVNGGGGLTAEVTGPAALETDLRHAFESADFALLAVTALLVLVPAAGDLPLAVAGVHPARRRRVRVHDRQRRDQDLRRRGHAGHEHLDVAPRRAHVRRGHGLLLAARGQIHRGAALGRGSPRGAGSEPSRAPRRRSSPAPAR